MSPGIEVEHEVRDGICVVRLSGTLDLSLGDHKILHQGVPDVVFDFDGVRRVTSFGILMWTRAIEELQASYVGMWRCRPCIVQQLNVVSDFARKCDLLSVYLPYACDACDKEFDVLWDLRDRHGKALKGEVATEPCPKCGKAADFDDLASNYFAFAHRIPPPSPPASVAARLITTQMSAVSRSVRKEPEPAKPRASAPARDTSVTRDTSDATGRIDRLLNRGSEGG